MRLAVAELPPWPEASKTHSAEEEVGGEAEGEAERMAEGPHPSRVVVDFAAADGAGIAGEGSAPSDVAGVAAVAAQLLPELPFPAELHFDAVVLQRVLPPPPHPLPPSSSATVPLPPVVVVPPPKLRGWNVWASVPSVILARSRVAMRKRTRNDPASTSATRARQSVPADDA